MKNFFARFFKLKNIYLLIAIFMTYMAAYTADVIKHTVAFFSAYFAGVATCLAINLFFEDEDNEVHKDS